jgi:hypothetical protein
VKKLMFSMFAEDVDMLPDKLFHRVLHKHRHDPARLNDMFARLFSAMATGGDFGVCIGYLQNSAVGTSIV